MTAIAGCVSVGQEGKYRSPVENCGMVQVEPSQAEHHQSQSNGGGL